MSRKSRKITVEQSAVQTSETSFPTAIYARLSVENSGKSEEKDVIQNQIEICKEYIRNCPYLNLVAVYADNGHTGTVFDRPEFNRLMSDIRSGGIKCLVVRDLSRFGRDYIETGTYLERVFPQIGLRFISVKEHFDSSDSDDDSLIVPLQNMINALYSKDISRKVSTALHAKIAEGTYRGGNLPYGYRWNENHDNMIPDEVTAPIVQKIFTWKIEGISNSEILNSEEYSYAKKAFDSEYSDLSRRLDEAVQRRNSFSEAMSENNKWIKLMKSVGNAERLTQELVDESIELVKVHEGGDIELTMKYKDIYELTVQSVKDVQEVMK